MHRPLLNGPRAAIAQILLALGGLVPAPAAAQQPDTTPAGHAVPPALRQAFELAARGREPEAAAAVTAWAASEADRPAADDRAATAVRGAVALTLHLWQQRLGDSAAVRQLLALRQHPMAQASPALADDIGVLCLEALSARGDDGAPALARELGYLQDLWLCGPFDNERGAAFGRDLPAEAGFARDTAFPGKLRPVAWRRLSALAPLGVCEFGAVLQPSDQAAAVVAVALRAERETAAALHLGSAGSFRVVLNGAEVGRRDVDRRFALDQDRVALPLRSGSNLLVVKFCHQDLGDFDVSLRLAAADGGRLGAVVASAEATDLEAAAAVAGDAPPTTPGTAGAAAPIADADGDARGLDAYWRALLALQRHASGEGDRIDRPLAERAAADLADAPFAHMLLAATRVRQAKIAAEVDENERRADYETVLRLDPEHTGAAVQLGRLLLTTAGLRRRAEALADQALAVAPTDEIAHLLHAEALAAAAQQTLARREVQLAAARADATPASLRAGLDGAEDLPHATAVDLAQRLAGGSGAIDDLVTAATALLRFGRVDQALQTLDRAERLHPLARPPVATRARLLEGRGDVDAALQAWGRWLQLSPDDDEALAAQSRLYARLGRTDDQLETLRQAVEINPNRRDDQRYLEFLAAETTPFYAAFQTTTDELRQRPTPPSSTEARDAVFHLLQQRVVHAHRNGTTSEYLHLCVRILTEEGARSWSRYRLPFYYGEQRGRMLACTVYKADGQKQEPRLSGTGVALPSLVPGDVVDVEGRVDDLAPSFFGDYFGLVHYFTSRDGGALCRSELVVLAEPGRDYSYQLAHGAPEPVITTAPSGATVYSFRLDDLPRDVPEPGRPDPGERVPLVRFSTFRDWDHFATWWWNLIRGQLETSPAMRQKVQELVAACTTQDERIAALYRFVTTDVRYEAWEFGVHGYKPYSTQVIFERRHGDCKDKALLLCALLAEIGVRAAPVLIHADTPRSKDDLSLPMVQHFNHCIAWMPAQDGRPAQFLDGTAIWHPMSTLPAMDQGADTLVVDRGTALLVTAPWTDPDHNATAVEYDLELGDRGGARARMLSQPLGVESVDVRAALAAEPARRREHVERQLVADFGPVEIGQLDNNDPLDYGAAVRLQVDFTVATVGQQRGSEWLLPTTFGGEPLAFVVTEPERTQPLVLGPPRRDDRTVRYRLPPGWRPRALPDPVERTAPFGAFAVAWRYDGDAVVVHRRVDLDRARIEPADYPALRDFVAALRAADAQRIVLQREGR